MHDLQPNDVFHFAEGGSIRVSNLAESTKNAIRSKILVAEDESLSPDI